MLTPPTFKAGLEDVVAGTTEICMADGREGRLVYCGYDIRDLAEQASFEEVVFLLHHKRLPNPSEFALFDQELKRLRAVPAEVLAALQRLPKQIHPMAALRTGVSLLGNFDETAEEQGREAQLAHSLRVVAGVATLVAAWARIRAGKEPVAPRADLSHAANFLYALTGQEPDPIFARAMNVALVAYADHELNASTFSGRATASTLTDVYSAVTAAVGALKGPLHGGANEQVMRTELEIGEVERAESWVRGALAEKRKLFGFGHRVYRTKDPRAAVLERYSEMVGKQAGDTRWTEIARIMERVVLQEKGLHANVDLYSGSLYYAMSIPVDLFGPIFAVSRVAGWTAHILEQQGKNRMVRHRTEYTGPDRLTYIPMESR